MANECAVNSLSAHVATQGIAFTLIIIRVELGNSALATRTNRPKIVWWKRDAPSRLDNSSNMTSSRVKRPAPIHVTTPKSSGMMSSDRELSELEGGRTLLYAAEKAINRSAQVMVSAKSNLSCCVVADQDVECARSKRTESVSWED